MCAQILLEIINTEIRRFVLREWRCPMGKDGRNGEANTSLSQMIFKSNCTVI
jgi:hypothetical protein